MKTLVNCTPTEFFSQTNKIRKSAEKWLKDTNILEIRRHGPEDLPKISDDMSVEDKEKILSERKEIIRKTALANLSEMFNVIIGEYPQETIELMALCCFIEPEDADNYTMSEYLANFNEILSDEAVLGFFSSLGLLGVENTSDVPQV